MRAKALTAGPRVRMERSRVNTKRPKHVLGQVPDPSPIAGISVAGACLQLPFRLSFDAFPDSYERLSRFSIDEDRRSTAFPHRHSMERAIGIDALGVVIRQVNEIESENQMTKQATVVLVRDRV